MHSLWLQLAAGAEQVEQQHFYNAGVPQKGDRRDFLALWAGNNARQHANGK